MRHFTLLSALPSLILAIYLLGASPVPNGVATSLNGVVLDENRAVIPDASIVLLSADKLREAKSKSDGTFAFVGLPPSIYDVRATHLGFEPQTLENVQITDGQSRRIEIILEVRPSTCGLQPVVSYEARTGKVNLVGDIQNLRNGSLKDATIILVPLTSGHDRVTTSRADGTFQFSDVEPGKYKLRVTRQGYYENSSPGFWIIRGNLTRIASLLIFGLNEEQVSICE